MEFITLKNHTREYKFFFHYYFIIPGHYIKFEIGLGLSSLLPLSSIQRLMYFHIIRATRLVPTPVYVYDNGDENRETLLAAIRSQEQQKYICVTTFIRSFTKIIF